MTAAISGPKTDYMERDRSWRWSGEPEQQGSPLDLPVEPLNLAHIFQVGPADGIGQLQQISDLPTGHGFLGCGELGWITCHPQDVQPAQIVDVRSDAVEDLAFAHVVQVQPQQVWMIGLHISVLGEVADHGVSSGPACNAFSNLLAPPSIEVCVQLPSPLPGLVAEGFVSWLLFLGR